MAEQTASTTPIAAKVIAEMKRHSRGKIIRLKDVIGGRAMAEGLQKTVVDAKGLAGMHPAHAVYTYAQNQISVMSEMLTSLDPLAPIAGLVSEAEEIYMPGGPPLSPLTVSYFTCWAFFDACCPPDGNETIGTTILEIGASFGMHVELLRVIRLMQQSRIGTGDHGHL